MPALEYAIIWTGYLSATSEPITKGTCVTLDAAREYVIAATAANRASVNRTTAVAGIALTNGDRNNPRILVQTVGPCPPEVTLLEPGTAARLIVNDDGLLEREVSVSPSNIVAGVCDADGMAYLLCSGAGGGATPGAPNKSPQWNNGGVFAGMEEWTYEGSGRQNVTTDGYITYGAVDDDYPSDGLIRVSSPDETTTDIITAELATGSVRVLQIADGNIRFGPAALNASATLNGSGIGINSGTDVVVTAAGKIALTAPSGVDVSSYVEIGAGTVAASGLARVPYSASARTILAERNAGDTGDLAIISSQSSEVSFGAYSTVRNTWLYGNNAGVWGYGGVVLYAGSAGSYDDVVLACSTINSGKLGLARPVGGYAPTDKSFRWATGSITKSDATDLTLSSAQFELPFLTFVGSPTGNFNVIGPNLTGTWFTITNSTAYTLTIKKSGGTGVTVGPGESRAVWHNGTDYAYALTTVAHVRTPYALSQVIVGTKDSGGTNRSVVQRDSAGDIVFGDFGEPGNTWVYSGAAAALWGAVGVALYAGPGGGFDELILRSEGTYLHTSKPLSGEQQRNAGFRWASGTITLSAATDYPLSAAEYELPFLKFTGTPTGNFNVIGPNTVGTWFTIVNDTPNILTIKKSGGTGVTIAAGETRPVWHNGTDYAYSVAISSIAVGSISGLDTGVAAWLADATADKLATALGGETQGTGHFLRAGTPIMATPKIADSDQLQFYSFTVGNLAADRDIALPVLAANDTFVFEAHTQTLTNKTISGASNTISNLAASVITSGTFIHERGGLETDASAFNGFLKIAGGATSAVTPGTGVETFITTPSGANLASALTTALSLSKVGAPTGTGLATVTSSAWDGAALTLGTNVSTFLGTNLASGLATFGATPSSANLRALLTDETGSGGAAVFASSPTIDSPTLSGTPTFTGTLMSWTADTKGTYVDLRPQHGQTTTNSVVTLETIAVPTDSSAILHVYVVGTRNDGSALNYAYVMWASYTNVAGALTIGATGIITQPLGTGATTAPTLTISGSNVLVKSGGVTSVTIQWASHVQSLYVID